MNFIDTFELHILAFLLNPLFDENDLMHFTD